MNCPRCNSSMSELDRDGITIDRCDRCRGVFLDRGELEKLIARGGGGGGGGDGDDRGRDRDRRDDDDDGDDNDRRGRRRSSWWEIFD